MMDFAICYVSAPFKSQKHRGKKDFKKSLRQTSTIFFLPALPPYKVPGTQGRTCSAQGWLAKHRWLSIGLHVGL